MKKKFFYSALFLMGMAFTGFTAASCSDDNDNTGNGPGTNPGTEGNGGLDAAANLDYNAENAASWRNYSLQVAKLLQRMPRPSMTVGRIPSKAERLSKRLSQNTMAEPIRLH